MFYSSPQPCGIVQPHSIAEIPVVLEVQTLGEHRTSVVIGVFGDERNPRVSARGDVCLCATRPARVQSVQGFFWGKQAQAAVEARRDWWCKQLMPYSWQSQCLTQNVVHLSWN